LPSSRTGIAPEGVDARTHEDGDCEQVGNLGRGEEAVAHRILTK
jgi:hypothetical protein